MRNLLIAALLLAIPAIPAAAQVVREDGTASISGVLVPTSGDPLPHEEWTFRSSGDEILFASLDAEIYITGSHEAEDAADAAADSGGGCEEGGPGHFYISVLAPDGTEICHAERPAPPPGWQRDPRVACVIPGAGRGAQGIYTIRVGLLGTGENAQPLYPFLLDLSLRRIAPSGVNIQRAIAQSRNRF